MSNNKPKIIYQNIQVRINKQLELFMNCGYIDIVCLTEHCLKAHQFMFSFNNHQIASSFSRVIMIRDGSLIIVRNNIKFKEWTDIVSRGGVLIFTNSDSEILENVGRTDMLRYLKETAFK